ncbi:MAG: hypothetical protein ACI4MG_03600 [Aristaeellaceae bacterium]
MSVSFCMALAGQAVSVSALFDETRAFCRDYLTDAPPSLRVEITPADIAFEKEKSRREAICEGRAPFDYSDAYLETLAVYRKIAAGLLDHDTLLFHGSVVAVDGAAYLFTAKSGTGKSTHTRLWQKQFGARAIMVNDDKPLLRLDEQGVTAYGTPWDGKHHRSANIACPLKAICILSRGEVNRIQPIDKKAALPMLCQQSYRPGEPAALRKTLSLVDRLGSSVRLYHLRCNMEPEAAQVAYDGMNA